MHDPHAARNGARDDPDAALPWSRLPAARGARRGRARGEIDPRRSLPAFRRRAPPDRRHERAERAYGISREDMRRRIHPHPSAVRIRPRTRDAHRRSIVEPDVEPVPTAPEDLEGLALEQMMAPRDGDSWRRTSTYILSL